MDPRVYGYWLDWRWRRPLAVLFSLVGGLLGPHMVVIYALVPFLVLVGIPILIRAIWLRLRSA